MLREPTLRRCRRQHARLTHGESSLVAEVAPLAPCSQEKNAGRQEGGAMPVRLAVMRPRCRRRPKLGLERGKPALERSDVRDEACRRAHDAPPRTTARSSCRREAGSPGSGARAAPRVATRCARRRGVRPRPRLERGGDARRSTRAWPAVDWPRASRHRALRRSTSAKARVASAATSARFAALASTRRRTTPGRSAWSCWSS
jgi:hypothetical protein